MSKVLYSLIAVLLVTSVVSSAASAGGIGQMQDFIAHLNNVVDLTVGQQTANSSTLLTVANDQYALAPHPTTAGQHQIGFFTQVGDAVGCSSQIGILQSIVGGGIQSQAITDATGPKNQNEGLMLLGTQGVGRANGGGTGTAYQLMVVDQSQAGANSAGPATQSTAVMGLQNTTVTGAPGAIGQAGSVVGVSTSQTQTVL